LYKVTSNYFLSKPVKTSQIAPSKALFGRFFTNSLWKASDLATGDLGARIFSVEPPLGGERWGKGKGCDIGYALAASSCEGANSVETCTVTALDAITAFAVPNPNYPSQSRRFFQVWLLFGLPRRADHSAYFGLAKV
jgi:hypothetical protein